MEQSPRLSLSYVMPSQAQKHVTVNESFRRLDALTQMAVMSRSETSEPGSPSEGDAYILPSGASGDAWDGYDEHDVAAFQDGAWAVITPREGFRAWVSDDDEFVVFDGADWSELASGGSSETAAKFGVNATADATNKLSVKSNAVLFDAIDAGEGGTGDAQIKVNKEAVGDTASHLFQTNFSGRAEFGLTGDDDFHVKVSPDGASWNDAILIDKDNGYVGVGVLPGGANAMQVRAASQYHGLELCNASNPIIRLLGFTGANDGGGFDAYLGGVIKLRLNADSAVPSYHNAGNFGVGTSSPGAKFHVAGGGAVFGSPTGGDKGAGAINAQSVYDDNSLLSCYVFDRALDGQIDAEKWDAKTPDRTLPPVIEIVGKPGGGFIEREIEPAQTISRRHDPMRKFAARAGTDHDPLTLDGYAKHWREKRHLTSMPNETTFDPQQGMATGEWIQRLVETAEIQAVLIDALNERVKTIEAQGRS